MKFKLLVKPKLVISIILLIICFIPIFIQGERSWILVHDNLDSEFVYLHLLKQSNNLFPFNSSGVVPQVFNGLDANFFHSEFSFIRLLFWLLPSFWAYVINSLLVRIIGVVGMQLLITTYFKSSDIPPLLTVFISLSFGLLPIYSLYGLSVMGQPILAWCFLNLRLKVKVYISLIIVFLFAFYTHFAMSAPFLLTAVFLFAIGHILFNKEVSPIYFIGLGVLFIGFFLSNYLTIQGFIFNDVPSHREDWHFKAKSVPEIFGIFINTLISGQYHSSKLVTLPILLFGFFISLRKPKNSKGIRIIIISILIICLFNSVYDNIAVLLESQFHILTKFRFNRFTFLLPFLFFLLLIKCFSFFPDMKKTIVTVSLIFFIFNLNLNAEIKFNAANLILDKTRTENQTNFSEFYSKDLFEEVNQYIGLPKEEYRVVSLGIHPSVSQFNGFYTLDSYQNNYPKSYKKKFRRVIEKELEKNEELKSYYDSWGSRCYLFSSELKETCFLNCKKTDYVSVNHLDINTFVLYQMGCKYLFSAVYISNAKDLHLTFTKSFENNESPYKIYLYKL